MNSEKLSEKYKATLATNYDKERVHRPKWLAEERVINEILSKLEEGAKVIDVPVGTGRFAHLYKKYSLDVVGVDASEDMLAIADQKAQELRLKWSLSPGDIRELPWPDRAFDASICIRLFQWFSASEVSAALKELARVSNTVVFGAPTYMPVKQIRTGEDLRNYFLQWKLRFYKWRTSSDLQCHELSDIFFGLSSAGLQLVDAHPIRSKRHSYAIYVAKTIAR